MGLTQQIKDDTIAALKAGETDVVSTLRLVQSAIKNEEIKTGAELSEDQTLKVVAREAKQRRESIDAYTKADRKDLADQESSELAIIETYLPAQMEDAELEKIVAEAVATSGATSMADMGKVMAAAMPNIAGRADGSRVSTVVKQLLNQG